MLKSAKILSMRCLVLKIPKTRCTLQSNYRGKNCTTFRRNLWSHLQLLWCSNKVLTPPLAWPHFWSTVKNSIQIFAQNVILETIQKPPPPCQQFSPIFNNYHFLIANVVSGRPLEVTWSWQKLPKISLLILKWIFSSGHQIRSICDIL